jgi:hypothetical protein
MCGVIVSFEYLSLTQHMLIVLENVESDMNKASCMHHGFGGPCVLVYRFV